MWYYRTHLALAAKAAPLDAAIRRDTVYNEPMAAKRKPSALAHATMGNQRGVAAPSSATIQKLPGPDVTMGDALRILKSEGEAEPRGAEARAIIEKLFVLAYLAAGVSTSELSGLQDEISMWTDHTLSQMEEHIESPSGFNNQTDEQYLEGVNNYPKVALSFNDLFKKRLAEHSFIDVLYKGLADNSRKQLARRLMDEGWSSGEAQRMANAIADDFSRSTKRPVSDGAGAAIEFALSAIRVMCETPGGASKLVLPSTAPEIWAERDPQEFPTAESFLRHHYGPRLGMGGDLTIASLGRLDPPLLHALNLEFRGERRPELHALLPTVKQRNDAKLHQALGYIPEGSERKNALTALSKGSQPRPKR